MTFAVASYNILAEAYSAAERYPFTPAPLLEPAARRTALIKHIAGLAADIVCLQEVEGEVFAALNTELIQRDYAGLYAGKGLGKPDGCATFFRRSLFTLAGSARHQYHDAALRNGSSGHIVQLLALDSGEGRLGIANTHLKWDPPNTPREASHGYCQIAELLEERDRFLCGCAAWIVCGDFNASPGSEVTERLREAGLHHAHGDDPGATCNANARAKIIDYLFFSCALNANPLPLPPVSVAAPLPGPGQPSDHVAVQARFDWA